MKQLERFKEFGKYYERGYVLARCPFHDDSHASLLIYETGYKCLACGSRGSLDYLDAHIGTPVKVYGGESEFSPDWNFWMRNDALDKAHTDLIQDPEAQLYLRIRGVLSLYDQAYLGYHRGFYSIPHCDSRGVCRDFSLRIHPDLEQGRRYWRRPKSNPMLYVLDWDRLSSSNTVFVVFGLFDLMALHLCGLPACTSTSGKNFPSELLQDYRKRFIIIPDKGEEREAIKLVQQLGWRGSVANLPYTDTEKDPNDILMQRGKDELNGLAINIRNSLRVGTE